MESLYVCQFSNGHIKVGRSIDPVSRIAAHADRVACMGVELVESHITRPLTDAARRESILIVLCTGSPGATRFKSEWFAGLDYPTVCAWAEHCAVRELQTEASPVRSIRQRLGLSQEELATELGCIQANVSLLERGQTVMPEMAKRLIRVARARGLPITYDDVYGPPDGDESNPAPNPTSESPPPGAASGGSA
jgi:DNA-binding transcriptional regulator YiaG